ncbi:uncharacterized protein J7T54_002838 [Emericellopsis cladophorae]|uniref:Uncharacterized protein n=1 Tax=Emericellopsis cladophorae TaxID=2686198 RepID=A0A9P9XTF3_9HYPO|nr:uncharacterized protein J7T54_002838 [Emericellopsis cladophorae]KAI6777579.1 hypothetical protein J7T54_002838 [Emericellopsis cladophorae]
MERQKTNLSLIIHNLQAQAIHHIQADIKDIAMSQCPDVPTRGEPAQFTQASTTQGMPSKELVAFRRSEADTDKDSSSQQHIRPVDPAMPSPFSEFDISEEEIHVAMRLAKKLGQENPNSNIYYKNTARGGKMQNGTLFSNAEYPGGTGANNINLPQSIYVKNYGIDVTEVHNGHRYELCDDITTTDVPQFLPDFFINNAMGSQTPGVENVGRGEMHNGNRIVLVRNRKNE